MSNQAPYKDVSKNKQKQSSAAFDAKSFLKTLPASPGVYRMLDATHTVIYVGKAKNLKNRVSSYFLKSVDSPKTKVLVSKIASMETTVTHTENEALLLENNLIKTLKPRYNVLYRDDKSYPYIHLSSQERFPRLSLFRGKQRHKGEYFGPYPSAGAVRETLNLLQKIFPVRQCDDNFFKNRSRPCLQYQIKRCTGPCTAMVSEEDYAQDVHHAKLFLAGKSNVVIDELVSKMEQASARQEYEQAAVLRDQITHLRQILEKQYIHTDAGDVDVIAVSVQNGLGCIQVVTIRGGRSLGSKAFYPKLKNIFDEQSMSQVLLDTFMPQYYLSSKHAIPAEIILSESLSDTELIQQVLSDQSQHKVAIKYNVRGFRQRWLEMAQQNANQSLLQYINSKETLLQRFDNLQAVLQLDELPTRLECFDISHSSGESTVASCVVMNTQGFSKSDYRRFNIKNITAGDDYAAMKQALMRRYQRVKKGEAKQPDILLIDGGKGQVKQAEEVMQELQLNDILLIGITKGPGRKACFDTLYMAKTHQQVRLPADSAALHLIQQIRDEAHRFAISGHRAQRQKTRNTSVLEQIPGLGPKRRQQVLKQFGGLQEVARAGVEDLASLHGISEKLAQLIYDAFHTEKE